MQKLKHILLGFAFLTLAGCTSISKLYSSGSATQKEFKGKLDFITIFDLTLVPVEINGKEYRFLYDTGAPMVISNELREELALKRISQSNVTDSQGKRNKLDYVWLDEISVGGVEFNKVVSIVADLKKAPEINCLQIDGILGANLMRLAVWNIDNVNNTMTFASTKDQLNLPKGEPVLVDFTPKITYTPEINLMLNDSVELKSVTFDTGYGGYLIADSDYLDSTFNVVEKSYGYGSTGLYGSAFDTTYEAKIPMTIGRFTQVAPVGFSVAKGKNLLGMDFFNQFNLVMDWNTNTMELYKNGNTPPKIYSLGMTPKWYDGKLVVGTIAKGSMAEEEGIKVGDGIVKLNTWNFKEPKLDTYCEMMIELQETRPDAIKVVLEDGRSYSFTKEDFGTKMD